MDDALTGTRLPDSTARPSGRRNWRKSSYSGDGGGGNCVEVCLEDNFVLIRDSKYRREPTNDLAAQPVIGVDAAQWDTFLSAVMAGRLG
ncbi:DUF397 domain-containing protein [Nocardia sp. NPDC052001]|uniref:DUF397 domain-containing protein n=1 Tax=Nocardia sp. NPDC052001 TaxID=3154853 RepID=UPI00342A707B